MFHDSIPARWRWALVALALVTTFGRPLPTFAQAKPTPTKPAPAAKPAPVPAPAAPAATPSVTPQATGSAAPQVEEGPKLHVADLEVRGNRTVSEETILLTIPIHAGQDVTRAQVMESLQRIYGLGFFLDVRAATEPVAGGVRLIFNVVENPVLKDTEISGATVFPMPELQKPFEPMKGKIINLKDVQAAIKDLEKRYADQGYVLARVIDLQVRPDGVLAIKLAEGTINAIKIAGNEETQDYVIRREITLKPGQIYNFNRMQDDLRRVYNLNYFEDIGIKYEPVPNDPTKVNVVVTVKEKQTGTFQLSAGWSNRDGPLGILSLRKDNLFGRSQSVSADVTVSQNPSAELNYFNPWIDEEHTSFGTSVYWRRYFNYYASFLEERKGLALSFGRPLFGQDPVTAQWRQAARIRVEGVGLLGGDQWNQPLDTTTGKVLPSGQNMTDLNTSLGYTVTFDSRDYVLNPNTGWFNTYSLDQYVPGVSSVKMTRLQLDLNRYMPLWFGHTLAVGWKLGTLQTPFGGSVPAYERFYSTGAYLIRGWRETVDPGYLGSLGPLGQTFSGDSFTLGSIEYRFPIVNILSGVVFGDSGIFWD
ncbi:MAG TPA: BamA/TamA family outer membrane protein, partial [Stenomitos sp.]